MMLTSLFYLSNRSVIASTGFDRIADGPITSRYRFIKKASWVMTVSHRCHCVVYSCSDASIAAWHCDYLVGKKRWLFCFQLVCNVCVCRPSLLLCPRHLQCVCVGGGGGVHIVSPLSLRTSVPSVPYVTLLVSVRYLLKGLVYWIGILYTGI